jgi:hypothetical protein
LKGSSVGKRGRPTTQKKKKKISESHSDKAQIIEKYRLSSIKKKPSDIVADGAGAHKRKQ